MIFRRFKIILLICILHLECFPVDLSALDQTIEVNGKPVTTKALIKDVIRISKNKSPKYITPIPLTDDIPPPARINAGEGDFCVECRDIANLSRDVSKIISKLNKDSPKDSVQLAQEALKLEAIADYTSIIGENGEERCIGSNFRDTKHFYEPRDFDKFELLLTSKIDLGDLNSLSIVSSNQKQKITWLRAKSEADDDIFIKVVSIQGEKPYFQVYRADDSFIDPKINVYAHKIPSLTSEAKLPKTKTKTESKSGEYSVISNQEYETAFGSVKIKKGLSLEEKYYIPKSVTLIDMSTSSQMTESTKFNTDVKISDRDQRVKMNVEYNGREIARAQVKANGSYYAGVTLLTPEYSNFELETDFEYDSNQTLTMKNDFRYHGSSIIKTGTVFHDNGQIDFTSDKSLEVFDDATVTMGFRYTKDQAGSKSDETAAFLRFSKRF